MNDLQIVFLRPADGVGVISWYRVDSRFIIIWEGRKELVYLTTHSTHFIYGYMASDILWDEFTFYHIIRLHVQDRIYLLVGPRPNSFSGSFLRDKLVSVGPRVSGGPRQMACYAYL